jgi:hypothetical protein
VYDVCAPWRQEVIDEIKRQERIDPSLAGLRAYVTVMFEFRRVFLPNCGGRTKLQVVESLAFVVFFFRIWAQWLRDHKDASIARDGPTPALLHDIEIAAACVINLLSFVSDSGLDIPIALSKLGTDVVETLWGMLGSWHSNKRVYTTADAFNRVRSSISLVSLTWLVFEWFSGSCNVLDRSGTSTCLPKSSIRARKVCTILQVGCE